jgi:hypothetical protein
MAEAFQEAMRRRLGIVGDMGASANEYAQSWNKMRQGAMRQPGGPSGGAVMRQPGGPSYGGPRGNLQSLLNFGRYLESQGFRVGENPHFGNGRVGRHTKGSRHYSGRAIDVNFAPGTSRREQQAIDRIVGLARQYGLRSIWRQPGHYNHAHFDF